MTLRRKSLITIAAVLAVLSMALYAISSRTLFDNALAAEEQETRRTVQVALSVLDVRKTEFYERVYDWSHWDDAHRFMQTGDASFVERNLVDYFFYVARLNAIVMADAEGRLRFATGYDFEKRHKSSLPRELVDRLRVGEALYGAGARPRIAPSGILVTSSGPMIIAVHPSYDSEGKGPVAGTMIWGRYLAGAEMERLARPIGMDVAIYQQGDPALPADVARVRAQLSPASPVVVRPLDEHMIAGYAAIADVYGQPAMILRVVSRRTILDKSRKAQLYMMLLTAVLGVVFGGVILLLLEKLVLARLARLNAEVIEIGARGDLSARVDAEGTDELSRLSGSINTMLETLDDVAHERERAREALRKAKDAAEAEREKSDQLLLNILPTAIAERLKQNAAAIADHFDDVTVMFADIDNFTPIAATMHPIELVSLLNRFFSIFDELAEKHGLEKIKTIGDSYMLVGGLPLPRPDHAEAVAEMALDVQASVARLSQEIGRPFQLRIGIDSGPAVAGVIGTKKFTYDLWGDSVNVASRMESHGLAGKIQITEATYRKLRDKFVIEKRGTIVVKGKGEMETYWLIDRRPSASQNAAQPTG